MVGGSRIYILASNGKQGPLRDVVERQKLEGYIQRYGDFEDLWMPLKEKDLRPFGFVTIKDSVAAQQFVERSPHKVPDASVEIIARWEHRSQRSLRDGIEISMNQLKMTRISFWILLEHTAGPSFVAPFCSSSLLDLSQFYPFH